MTNKHFIGTEDGDAVAAFVQRIEEKTGKSLRSVQTLHIMQENSGGTPEILENRVSVSMEFFPPPAHPPESKTPHPLPHKWRLGRCWLRPAQRT